MAMRPGEITYGFPLFFASNVPFDRVLQNINRDQPYKDQDADQQEIDEQKDEAAPKPSLPPPSASTNSDRVLFALGGGGGEGNNGIPNAIVLSAFDFASGSLSDPPVFRLETARNLPYRMAMHPGGKGFICSFPDFCRWYEWDFLEEDLAMRTSEMLLTELEDVGLQLALAFNAEGSVLAAGGEDGHLRVFKWPTMEVIFDQRDAFTAVKDIDFSPDSKYLVCLGEGGPCRVWDLAISAAVATLPKEDGEKFGFCRFSQSMGENQILYIAGTDDFGKVISFDNSWRRLGSKRMSRDPISAFSLSTDGSLLALGTIGGDVVIANSSNLQQLTTVKKAHIGLVTALAFSRDSRALLSVSMDSRALVTLVDGKRNNGLTGLNTFLVFLMLLLSFLIYHFFITKNSP